MINTYTSKGSANLSLTQKGLRQAHRNDSSEIWKLISSFQEETDADSCNSSIQQMDEPQYNSFLRSPNLVESQQIYQQNNDQINLKTNQQDRKQLNQQTILGKLNAQNKSNNVSKTKKPVKQQKQSKILLQSEDQQQQDSQHLKKMNDQISRHLQQERYCTRNLSNSAFAKLYKRPCIQSYGYGNASKESQSSNNLFKTHNITPHTLENNPDTYQTYKNALKFAKRTKIDDENQQQKIRRQFLKWFDHSTVEAAQIQLNKKNKLKRAKSEQNSRNINSSKQLIDEKNKEKLEQITQKRQSLKQLLGSNQPIFVYKSKDSDGEQRLSKDRHGLTCYVDSSFNANEKAIIKFQSSLNPIYPEKIKEEDMQLDQKRRQNYQKSVEEGHNRHYLVPCVVTPYDKGKYQYRKKRVQSTFT